MDKLFVNRKGKNNEAYMKTNKIIDTFNKYSKVIWKNNNLLISNEELTIKNIKLIKPRRNKINIKIIENDEIIETNKIIESNNNILGKNLFILINDEILKIPVEVATNENLNYYLCSLIENGDTFNLYNNNDIQNINISIGNNYFKDYILQSGLGDGLYIEIHDTPHFHQPLNSNCYGYIIIGKIKKDVLIMTAFSIPFGKAIYIPPNTYHCDACLIGDYNVIYTITGNYKTYLIYNEDSKKFTDIEFI